MTLRIVKVSPPKKGTYPDQNKEAFLRQHGQTLRICFTCSRLLTRQVYVEIGTAVQEFVCLDPSFARNIFRSSRMAASTATGAGVAWVLGVWGLMGGAYGGLVFGLIGGVGAMIGGLVGLVAASGAQVGGCVITYPNEEGEQVSFVLCGSTQEIERIALKIPMSSYRNKLPDSLEAEVPQSSILGNLAAPAQTTKSCPACATIVAKEASRCPGCNYHLL